MSKIILALFVLSFSGSVFAVDCPAQIGDENYIDKVLTAIKGTAGCEEGSEMAEACSLGASGDAPITQVAQHKCEGDFLKKLTIVDKQIYMNLQARCDTKYKNMQGTMYISMNAFCRLQVARLYSELYTPAE